jgi:hypothetical protein
MKRIALVLMVFGGAAVAQETPKVVTSDQSVAVTQSNATITQTASSRLSKLRKPRQPKKHVCGQGHR